MEDLTTAHLIVEHDKNLPYRPLEVFAPVSLAVSSPLIMMVHASVPAKSVRELIVLAQSRPGQLNYSSAGNGTSSHLAAELFKKTAKVEITHVPYKGATQALTDAVAGEVSVHFSGILIALPHVQSGRLRALGLTSTKRLPSLPDMNTVAESGLPGFAVSSWWGLLAPAATPRPITAQLQREIAGILRAPGLRDRLAVDGIDSVASSPEEFGVYIRQEIATWAKVLKDSGAQ